MLARDTGTNGEKLKPEERRTRRVEQGSNL
jgi:hypothetical protein